MEISWTVGAKAPKKTSSEVVLVAPFSEFWQRRRWYPDQCLPLLLVRGFSLIPPVPACVP